MVVVDVAACNTLNFFSRFFRSEGLVYIFFRTALLWKLSNIRFSYNNSNFSSNCLLIKAYWIRDNSGWDVLRVSSCEVRLGWSGYWRMRSLLITIKFFVKISCSDVKVSMVVSKPDMLKALLLLWHLCKAAGIFCQSRMEFCMTLLKGIMAVSMQIVLQTWMISHMTERSHEVGIIMKNEFIFFWSLANHGQNYFWLNLMEVNHAQSIL